MTVPLKSRFYVDPQKPDLDECKSIAFALKYEPMVKGDDLLFVSNVLTDLCKRIEELEQHKVEHE